MCVYMCVYVCLCNPWHTKWADFAEPEPTNGKIQDNKNNAMSWFTCYHSDISVTMHEFGHMIYDSKC